MAILFEDLRFFIGTFFLIIGTILIVQGALVPAPVEGFNLNLIAGIGFVIFAICALFLVAVRFLAHRRA